MCAELQQDWTQEALEIIKTLQTDGEWSILLIMALSHSSKDIEYKQFYSYDKVKFKYTFHSESKLGKDFTMSKECVDSIVYLYSKHTGSGKTIREISDLLRVPVEVVQFAIKALAITHNSLPLTEEVLEVQDENILVQDMLKQKAFNISQKFQKEDWKRTQVDALKWQRFEEDKLKPFKNFLQNWKPEKYTPIKLQTTPSASTQQKNLLVGCSDWHYGLIASERYLFNQKEWNINKTVEAVKDYSRQICALIQKEKYSNVSLLGLGDLIHGLDGKTDKGTILEAHPLNEEQLEIAFNSILSFVKDILSVAKNVVFYGCPGNHSALGDFVVYKMLEVYFREEKRIKFNITNKRNILFEWGDNLFLMEHGYASVAKDRLPKPGKQRENYINNLFMSKTPLMAKKKHFYYLSADQHHSESYELTSVEGYMFPTLVGGCRHADNSGYKARPRQSALVVDKNKGVTDVKFFYFD